MSEKLVRDWRLTGLRVRLDLERKNPAVVVEFVTHPDPEPVEHVLWTKVYALSEFNLPRTRRLTGGEQLLVPAGLADLVVETLSTEGFDGALWLLLVPPHGYLGAVPWERVLVPLINRPLARVPDRLPVAHDPGRAWSLALVVNAPENAQWPAEHVPSLISSLVDCVTDVPLEIQVFADRATTALIRSRTRPWPGLSIHDPPPKAALDPTASSGAWSAWITGGLRGRSVSSMHLLADATLDTDRPLLVLSGEPGPSLLGADAVAALADAVGAATVSFGSPPGNRSDLATRLLADAVGFNRPGPTGYVDVSQDFTGTAVGGCYRFLAQGGAVPYYASVFAYLQPEQLEVAFDGYPPPLGTSPGDEVQEIYANVDELPGWVASSERYVDAKVGELIQASRSEVPTVATKQAYVDGAHRGLTELRSILDQHVPRNP